MKNFTENDLAKSSNNSFNSIEENVSNVISPPEAATYIFKVTISISHQQTSVKLLKSLWAWNALIQ